MGLPDKGVRRKGGLAAYGPSVGTGAVGGVLRPPSTVGNREQYTPHRGAGAGA
jgi:hypothetical protein